MAVPTKGNLMATKKSLSLAKVGYELLDKKRNILIREMMALIDRASRIQGTVDKAFADAYKALEQANITLGFCDELSKTVPFDTTVTMDSRSIMGVEIPMLTIEKPEQLELHYGLNHTNARFDEAVALFMQAKYLTVELAEIENSVYRLAVAIKQTQKRANALKNIMIPKFEEDVKFITDALDEKDREEFSRLKVIKKQKTAKQSRDIFRKCLTNSAVSYIMVRLTNSCANSSVG